MQPCQLNFVGRDDFLRFLKEHADASLHATQHLARDCSDSYGVVRTIGLSHSVSERFARFLLDTAAAGEVSHGTVRVRLAMTHEEISNSSAPAAKPSLACSRSSEEMISRN